MGRPKVVVIVGPTASGKTRLSLDLAAHFGGEVISADSMQVYKYMDIGTAKPTSDEMRGIPHHLIDLFEPDTEFSVADYVARANSSITDILTRGKLPLVVGGTGLYVSSLVDNIQFSPDTGDGHYRRELLRYAQEGGEPARQELLAQLHEVDPETAEALHHNNIGRIARALEVHRHTGKPASWHRAQSRSVPPAFDSIMLGINYKNRAELYARIDSRVDAMLAQGLAEEARQLIARGFGRTASQAIGYKELLPYLDGTAPLEGCVNTLKQHTRNYAKRQLTWFLRDSRVHWLYADDLPYDELLAAAVQHIENCLGKTGEG